jgi:NTE family protein
MLPPEYAGKTPLKPVKLLVIAPSERLDDIAARHVASLPAPIRTMLSGIGATESRGARWLPTCCLNPPILAS